ncbi:hypothetical protein LR004_01535 [Candidatus Gracilibacteria bacterium]|nr:hypothetical protein [Candidatus Gracilibacteria bacterium]
MSNLNILYSAIKNEVAIDKYIIDKYNKINKQEISYVPVRSVKTLPIIKSLKIGNKLYFLISICFLLTSPFFFLLQTVKNIINMKKHRSGVVINKKVFLSGTNKTHLLRKPNEKDIQCLIIAPSIDKQNQNIASTFKAKHFLLAYLYSIIGIIYLSIKIKDKRNILQAYIAFDFFLVMLALKDIKQGIETVYFCNHFDRWAVLIDNIYFNKNLILIQHGVLPESISLPYKLENINEVFVFNKSSEKRFTKFLLTNTAKTKFTTVDISLHLQTVKHDKKTILVIGQPLTIERELEIINRIGNDYTVYVKPHPGFSPTPYYNIKNTILIEERSYYPKVDLVLNYESTLGIEYEASNIDVIWWKGMEIEELVLSIKKTLKKA